MVGSLWANGVAIDPGRLIDDADTAYYLIVVGSYRKFHELRARENEEAKRAPAT